MKTIVVIPTYDEKDNVRPMSEAVQAACAARPPYQAPVPRSPFPVPRSPFPVPRSPFPGTLELLFVDDNSPDGTGAVIDGLVAENPSIRVLHRERKQGLGRAYVAGFARALELGADFVIQMDCDFSHDPADIPRLIAAITTPLDNPNTQTTQTPRHLPGLVLGSRYVPGGSTPGWPFKRRLISRCGGIFIRTVTGLPVRDPTGGFKCWRRETLEKIGFGTVESAGYSFQLEMNHRTWKAGIQIKEIPISFTDRVAGYSKITAGIAKESLRIAWKLRR